MSSRLYRILLAVAALLMAAATALGAYASHGLDGVLEAGALRTFETAIDYQFFHALGLIGLCIYGQTSPDDRPLALGTLVVTAGTVLFCAGVYVSGLDGPDAISSLAPAGGVALIAGWLTVAYAVVRRSGRPPQR